MRARPSHVLVVTLLLISIPHSSNQQFYGRTDGYFSYGRSSDPNYYDSYYKYTHNQQPRTVYYGYSNGRHGQTAAADYYDRRNEGRSAGPDYRQNYHDNPNYGNYYQPTDGYNGYNNYNYNGCNRDYYDDYYGRAGRPNDVSDYRLTHYNYAYSRKCGYPVTPGWGYYEYSYGRNLRDNSARNVNPFPGTYVGLGSVHYALGGKDVDLRCNLSKDDQEVVSNVIWVKVENAYRYDYGAINPPEGFATNPYFCPSGGCIYRDIDFNNKRFFADIHNGVATLHIYDTQPRDYGIYRCSASRRHASIGAADTETTYQIVEYFN